MIHVRQNQQTCNSLPTMLDVEVDNTIMIHKGSINILKTHVWSEKQKNIRKILFYTYYVFVNISAIILHVIYTFSYYRLH